MASGENNLVKDRPFERTLQAGLYIVATPIGNLGDISRRALEVLKAADLIACEDTRVTAKLLSAFGMKGHLVPYHEHNGDQMRPKILDALASGQRVALVSDAGTPLISDPGYKLVAAVQDAGHMVTSIPGPSALITALTLAGLPTDRFIFAGFPPNKSGARQTFYSDYKDMPATLVFYESARRLTDSLSDALAVFGDRNAAVCRELTKKFEETRRGKLQDLIAHYQDAGNPKGEVVLVIDRPAPAENKGQAVGIETEDLLKKALDYMSVKDASAFVASVTGEKKKTLYQQALTIKEG